MRTREGIEKIERLMRVKLPRVYRQLLESYPSQLSDVCYCDDPAQGGPRDFELLSSPREVLKLNMLERSRWESADYSTTPLPQSFFFIGFDGCGNLFAIDLTCGGNCPVFEFDHERPGWIRRASSLDNFVQQLSRPRKTIQAKEN